MQHLCINDAIPFENIKRIAVIRRNGLGDVLCSIPLVLRCKELMPEATVTLFLEENMVALAKYLQGPDEIVFIEKKRSKYFSLAKLALRERKKAFDLAISAKTTPMKLINFFLLSLGAKYRAAYVGNSWTDRWINRSRHPSQVVVHQALQSIHLIDPLLENVPERLYPILRGIQTTPRPFSQKTLLLSLSNNRVGSRLSVERIASLCNGLSRKHTFAIAISLLPKELAEAQKLSSLLIMENKICLTPHVAEFLGLIQSADWVFSGDGGLTHLSAALRKPSLFVFGGIHPKQWGPLNSRALVLFAAGHVMQIPEKSLFHALDHLMRHTS